MPLGDFIGSMLWVGVVGAGGYAIGHALAVIFDDIRAHERWIADVLFPGVLICWPGKDATCRSNGAA